MAGLASPVITSLLSLGNYAQDLYERCLTAPTEFQEAKSELLALQTALTHLEFLTKSPLFAAGDSTATTPEVTPPQSANTEATLVEDGEEVKKIEEIKDEPETETAIVKAVPGKAKKADDTDVKTGIPSIDNSPIIPPKTRADIAQLATGCRAVLDQFQQLLDEHQGMKDIAPTPRNKRNNPGGPQGIMQLFAGRPSGAIDRYKFAQEGVQKVNAIRAKLTYHTGAITLMLTVLGSSSLGRIEGSLSKLETMMAAAALEREKPATNIYVTAQQNNQYMTREQQEYLQAMGAGLPGGNTRGMIDSSNMSEQEFLAAIGGFPVNRGRRSERKREKVRSGGGGGGSRRIQELKERGGDFWRGGRVDTDDDQDDFFAHMNSWSARPSRRQHVRQVELWEDEEEQPDSSPPSPGPGALQRRGTHTGAFFSRSSTFNNKSSSANKMFLNPFSLTRRATAPAAVAAPTSDASDDDAVADRKKKKVRPVPMPLVRLLPFSPRSTLQFPTSDPVVALSRFTRCLTGG